MKITNINGTSNRTCGCGSWLEHWKKFSGQTSTGCVVLGCSQKSDIVGAHVQKDSIFDKNWYIAPLCKDHNNKKGESIVISDNTHLVPANTSETCEKL